MHAFVVSFLEKGFDPDFGSAAQLWKLSPPKRLPSVVSVHPT